MRVHSLLCSTPDGSQSGTQYPQRAAEAVWPQWQAQQQSQNNAEQQPHPQGNQDMFPVSDANASLSPNTFLYFFCFSQITLGFFCVCVCVFQDVLSILDQPPNFNNDDFEIPIYSQFNEWPGPAFCPSCPVQPSAIILFFFPCSIEIFFIALHGSNCTAQLGFIYMAPVHNRCVMMTSHVE